MFQEEVLVLAEVQFFCCLNLVAVLLLEGETKLNLIMWQLSVKRPEAMLR